MMLTPNWEVRHIHVGHSAFPAVSICFFFFYKCSNSCLQKQKFQKKVEFSTFVFPTLHLMTAESLTVIVALTKLTVTKDNSNTMQILQQKGSHVLKNLISLPAL